MDDAELSWKSGRMRCSFGTWYVPPFGRYWGTLRSTYTIQYAQFISPIIGWYADCGRISEPSCLSHLGTVIAINVLGI